MSYTYVRKMGGVKKKVPYKKLDSGKAIQYTKRQIFSKCFSGKTQAPKEMAGEIFYVASRFAGF